MSSRWTSQLKANFNLVRFRPWQLEAITELLEGSGKVLVVAPTGGGKSLCYQFPATVFDGTSIVISPLIALMEDQVRALEARGIAATYLASTLNPAERRAREEAMSQGRFKLVYVAPEALLSGFLLKRLVDLRPPFVAVDEAHCISQWGHDFRPSYLELGAVLRQLGAPRVLACTATATPMVREEIQEKLGLPTADSNLVLRGFSRPNLRLSAMEIDQSKVRHSLLLDALKQALDSPSSPSGGAIIYTATRNKAESLASSLKREGWNCDAYHAGLSAKVREKVNKRFALHKLSVVVATNAFGMGIDRADIRLVAHVQAPGSVEAYYQEVGRAGRDGQPAEGLLLSSSGDFGLRRKLIGYSNDRESNPAYLERQWQLFLDMMRYIEAGSCRHDFILRYFGDERETLGGCGHCDVCERLEEKQSAKQDEAFTTDDVQIVRKALSGVARNRRRAGLSAVADMLVGVKSSRQRELGLDQLSTYGLLKEHPKPWVMALLRRLITAGLTNLSASEFPVPYLTERGVRVMKDQEPPKLLLPPEDAGQRRKNKKALSSSSSTDLTLSNADHILFEKLRATRLELARAKGVPAYIICHDRTLKDIATLRPTTLQELADAHGMGPARIENYGKHLCKP
ncbi:MAG: ATP-dependent DNA helicase RecQ [Myxococcales bacterium]|nr:MAG: ATP-dependent DNA helicase RecQ [Myxococcales bacterium]